MNQTEEYPISLCKRRRLISLLTESGFILVDNSTGQNVYVAKPTEDHRKILGHHLPVGFIRTFYYKLVNLDEPSLTEHHERLRGIYASVMES